MFNYTGDVKQADESIPELLSKQVQSGVLMEKIIRKLIELDVTNFVEIGPRKCTVWICQKGRSLGEDN